MKDKSFILCYTREPIDERIYANKLAYSMHLAYSEDGKEFIALNHNSGVLFAKATDNPDGTMNAKSLTSPFIFPLKSGLYGVLAIRTGANGEDDDESKGKVLFFQTKDLLQYEEVGLIDLHIDTYIKEVTCQYNEMENTYDICWSNNQGTWYKNSILNLEILDSVSPPQPIDKVEGHKTYPNIQGLIPGNMIEISTQLGKKVKARLSTPENVAIDTPSEINVSSLEELKNTKVKAVYNDGTFSMKTVNWEVEGIDWTKPGTYDISGTVHQDQFSFPFIVNRADPCIGKWNGKYYFIATNDVDGNRTLFIRQANTIPELQNAEEKLILDTETYEHIGNLLWAPELHVIEEELYIFHAATPEEFYSEEAHVMKLKKNGNPTNKEDWSEPKRVVKKDGSYLCEAGKTISLDMTCFQWKGDYYVAWSERQFLPVDIGAWVYIAKIDPTEPWKLITDPVLLTKPDYGWANNHTFVDEGPFAIFTDEKIFLTFSSAAIDESYVVGLLTCEHEADLLNPKSWVKSNYPLLTSRSVEGEFGPGHNSYVTDENGYLWNVYHAREGLDQPRCSGIRRVHFDIDGYPVLDLTEDRDINPELKHVSTKLVVK